jgi:hypothetical protein
LQPTNHGAAHRPHDRAASFPKERPSLGPAFVVLDNTNAGYNFAAQKNAECLTIERKRVAVVAVSDQRLGLRLSHLEIKRL